VCGPGVHESVDGVVIEPDLELHGFSGREPCDGVQRNARVFLSVSVEGRGLIVHLQQKHALWLTYLGMIARVFLGAVEAFAPLALGRHLGCCETFEAWCQWRGRCPGEEQGFGRCPVWG
jgi:hypothetical protein